ncbi:MAG: phage major capsid protein [Chloroflexi bacterium HGW-Chloroflexi-5]|jgi:HK97 family phage major capsid protein|nr:MAG: phage major capsid protein [Chloroflexi bacterium HGW-Chloroflexi-5]
MGYDNSISRTDAASLIPQGDADEIMTSVEEMNPILSLSRRTPNMVVGQEKQPVMSALASAYFITGDTSLIQTTEVNWKDKYLDPEGLAAIIPIPRSVIRDSKYDIIGQCKPELIKAFSLAISNAAIRGVNIPASWTTNMGAAGLIAGSLAAGNTVSLAGGYTDMYEAILGEKADGTAGLFGKLEDSGFMVSGSIASTSMKRKFRNVRDEKGQPIFVADPKEKTPYSLDGAPCYFPTDGSVPDTSALLIAGQWDQVVWAYREEIRYEILKEAVIQDASGKIIYNLAQQDMVALKAVMYIAIALPNPINRAQPTEASRYPIAVMTK